MMRLTSYFYLSAAFASINKRTALCSFQDAMSPLTCFPIMHGRDDPCELGKVQVQPELPRDVSNGYKSQC